MSFQFDNTSPIYLQIIKHIKMLIINKTYKPNEKLPSVRNLSVQYAVNPNTIQKALFELENMGLIYTERTNGKFVTSDTAVIDSETNATVNVMVDDFCKSMEKLGLSKEQIIEILSKKE